MVRNLLATLTILIGLSQTTFAQTTIFTEDFESGMDGWTVVIEDTSTVNSAVIEFAPGWITLADPLNTTDTVCGATSYFTEPGKARRWLISPAISLGAYGNILSWSARSFDPSYPDNYQVLVSETTNDIASFTDTLAWVGAELEDWSDYSLNISDSGYVDQTVYFAFILNSYDMFKLFIDDVNVVIEDPASIAEDQTAWFDVYPNPAKEVFRIKSDKKITEVRVFDLNGKLVKDTEYVQGGINVSELNKGLFIVEAVSDTGDVSRKRLVVE